MLHAREPGDPGDACDENQPQDGGRRLSYTTRVHVPEQSHCGIVPMNHSDKDGTSLAESEERRLLIKENTFSSDTHPNRAGLRVSRGWASVGKSRTLGRDSSEIRTGCANEHQAGSVRGAARR
jgi:hypothetical protein